MELGCLMVYVINQKKSCTNAWGETLQKKIIFEWAVTLRLNRKNYVCMYIYDFNYDNKLYISSNIKYKVGSKFFSFLGSYDNFTRCCKGHKVVYLMQINAGSNNVIIFFSHISSFLLY